MKQYIFLLFILKFSTVTLGQDYVTIYSDCNYRGKMDQLRPGRYSLNRTRVGSFNLSSIQIPDGMKVTIYNGQEPGSGNMKLNLYKDANCLTTQNWNDMAGSIVVEGDNRNNNDYQDNYGNNNQNMVTLYADCDYRGINKSFGLGYHNIRELGALNDKVTSIKIPHGFSVTIYSNPDYQGNQASFESSIDCMQNNMNDKTSSILVSRSSGSSHNKPGNSNGPGGNMVIVYRNCDFSGESKQLSPGYHDIRELGSLNDKISSIYVPRGYTVTLYVHPNYQGASRKTSNNINCLAGTIFDDKVSSILITRN